MTRQLPTSTYRYQISPRFSLQDAAEDLPRLVDLGVDALYLSPVLTSTTGSDHGYDWTDCTTVDPQRGEEGWQVFIDAARAHGFKVVLDIVPNHCGIQVPHENPAWWSVLREGRDSRYAHWFDIDWDAGPIVVPVLPEDGSLDGLMLSTDRTELVLHDLRLPLAPGSASEGDDPAAVAGRQHYRLAPWTAESTDLNYRRFFAVSTLAGLRIEDERVFDETHERILRMVDEGQLDGLRIDHPDGLTDPGEYFRRLRARIGDELWLVVEKIQGDGEPLPTDWPVDGSSGYDAMAELTRLFTDPAAERPLTEGYLALTGDSEGIDQHILRGKLEIGRALFGSEVARIQRTLPEGLRTPAIADAIIELAARVPVYRTYLPAEHAALDQALAATRVDRPGLRSEVDALAPLLGDVTHEAARRFQQLSGALMAKGLEDTAWYRWSRWIGANEVGGHPGRLATTLDDFHDDLRARQGRLPHSMVALSTHDTKRGEDVRAALATLTELPEQALAWGRTFLDATDLPDRPFAWFLAQTLAGVGPIDPGRLHAYATKAMREANTLTSWNAPDEGYEARVHAAIDRALDDPALAEELSALRSAIAPGAAVNVLSQKLVQLTMPGIPDVYRGTEIVEDTLVDPDNRRPVDRARVVAAAAGTEVPTLDDLDAAKHWVVRHALELRRNQRELFTGYSPIALDGPLRDHLVGFDRGGAVILATRLPLTLAAVGGWGDASLDLGGALLDVFTGREHTGPVRIDDVFRDLPVALLVRC